jgi:hypothetical protein
VRVPDFGRISQLRALHTCPRRKNVRSRAHAAGNFAHGDSPSQESVRNQRSVAAPRECLCAHQNNALSFGEIDTTPQAVLELLGLHVIGVATEAGVTPSGVDRVDSRVAQSSKSRDVLVVDSHATKCWRQFVAIELRIVPGPRNRSHVDDTLHAMRLEESDEYLYRTCRVPDREDHRLCAVAFAMAHRYRLALA